MRPLLVLALLLSLLTAGCAREEDGPSDRDRDNLPDAAETTPRTIVVTLLDGPASRVVTSDPDDVDTDDDGLLDLDEYAQGTDPRDPDTDADGLLDGPHAEALGERAAAWRARGILQGADGRFLGEQDLCPEVGGLRPNQASSDRPFPDALGDGEELSGWTVMLRGTPRHVVSQPCWSDADRDNLPDDLEREAGSDPNLADSDGDGVQDGADADPARDLALLVRNLTATASNGTVAAIRVQVGVRQSDLAPGTGASLEVDVDDQTSTRGSLPVGVILTAVGPDGQPLALTPDPRGAILRFDLLRGTVDLGDQTPLPRTRVELSGRDGSVAFDWGVARR